METPWWLVLLGLVLCVPLGAAIACAGYWIYEKVRTQQSKGWPKTEPFQKSRPDSWQARHRKAQDKGRLRPARRQPNPDAVGPAKITKARMRTGKKTR